MKKLFAILGVVCALALSGAIYSYSSAYVPEQCKYVSGANVTGECRMNGGIYCFFVILRNNSGSRCSASFTVEGKLSNGSWETVTTGILSAANGKTDSQYVNIEGYTTARLVNVSTWKCD